MTYIKCSLYYFPWVPIELALTRTRPRLPSSTRPGWPEEVDAVDAWAQPCKGGCHWLANGASSKNRGEPVTRGMATQYLNGKNRATRKKFRSHTPDNMDREKQRWEESEKRKEGKGRGREVKGWEEQREGKISEIRKNQKKERADRQWFVAPKSPKICSLKPRVGSQRDCAPHQKWAEPRARVL